MAALGPEGRRAAFPARAVRRPRDEERGGKVGRIARGEPHAAPEARSGAADAEPLARGARVGRGPARLGFPSMARPAHSVCREGLTRIARTGAAPPGAGAGTRTNSASLATGRPVN